MHPIVIALAFTKMNNSKLYCNQNQYNVLRSLTAKRHINLIKTPCRKYVQYRLRVCRLCNTAEGVQVVGVQVVQYRLRDSEQSFPQVVLTYFIQVGMGT